MLFMCIVIVGGLVGGAVCLVLGELLTALVCLCFAIVFELMIIQGNIVDLLKLINERLKEPKPKMRQT